MLTTTKGNRPCGWRICRTLVLLAAVGGIMAGWPVEPVAQDVPDGALAAGIRSNGYPCDHVIGQERTSDSPTVLRVRCNSGLFQVTMKGESVAKVASLE